MSIAYGQENKNTEKISPEYNSDVKIDDLKVVDKKYLREYRCPSCHKLLAKGTLFALGEFLEVKCRGCHTVCVFKGEDVGIVTERARLIKEGIIKTED